MSDANNEGCREAAAEARDGQLHPVRPALRSIIKPASAIVFILDRLSQLFIALIHDVARLLAIDEHPFNSDFPTDACSFSPQEARRASRDAEGDSKSAFGW